MTEEERILLTLSGPELLLLAKLGPLPPDRRIRQAYREARREVVRAEERRKLQGALKERKAA